MRWIVVKFINLIVVLVVVTFLVAAIFTGPLAERQRDSIAAEVRQMYQRSFQNVPQVSIVKNCINRVGEDKFRERANEAVQSMIEELQKAQQGGLSTATNTTTNTTTGQNATNATLVVKEYIKALSKYSPDQQVVILQTLGSKMIELLPRASSDEGVIAATVKSAKTALAAQGINVDNETLRIVASDMLSVIGRKCKSTIIEDEIQLRIKRQGLDKPWYILSIRYTKQLLTFQPLQAITLSTQYWPYQGDKNAIHIILERLPYSISLFTTSSILTLLIAMPLALYAARRPGGILDNVITGWSVFSVSMPWWWLAMVFIWLLTIRFHIFPFPYQERIDWRDLGSVARMAALPVFTVTILSIGDTAYRIRNILLDVFNEDFVMVARAKGVPEHLVLRKHVMRPAAPPLVTIVVFGIVLSVFSGAIITELIFNWFGLGRLYWEAIVTNDIPVILELTYISTLLYLVLRFLLDLLYTLLDPRIRRA